MNTATVKAAKVLVTSLAALALTAPVWAASTSTVESRYQAAVKQCRDNAGADRGKCIDDAKAEKQRALNHSLKDEGRADLPAGTH